MTSETLSRSEDIEVVESKEEDNYSNDNGHAKTKQN